jgi:hypothetical protein
MMTDDAAGSSAENAMMPRKVPGDATDRGPLQATGRLRRSQYPAGTHENSEDCR